MTPVLRVLLVSPKPPPNGGICRWTVLLLSWLQRRPQVAWRHVDISPRWRAIHDLSVPKRLVGGTLQGVRDAWCVLVQLARFRPDVIHLTSTGGLGVIRDLAVLFLASLFRVPVVQHIRNGRIPDHIQNHRATWRLLRLTMDLARKVVVIDGATEAALRTFLPAGKLVFVPNAITLTALPHPPCRPPAESKTVYFLGWVIPPKGIRELMEAWRLIGRSDWELIVAGPGDEAYRREVVKHAGPNAKVRFLGEVSPAKGWELMQQADIFTLPSYTEGFPNVVLEAMAAGKAIVATRVGALPEMLDANANQPRAELIEPKDSQALADALSRLMDDAPLRADLGRRAREKVESHYDADVVFGCLLGVWEGLALRRAGIAPASAPGAASP